MAKSFLSAVKPKKIDQIRPFWSFSCILCFRSLVLSSNLRNLAGPSEQKNRRNLAPSHVEPGATSSGSECAKPPATAQPLNKLRWSRWRETRPCQPPRFVNSSTAHMLPSIHLLSHKQRWPQQNSRYSTAISRMSRNGAENRSLPPIAQPFRKHWWQHSRLLHQLGRSVSASYGKDQRL